MHFVCINSMRCIIIDVWCVCKDICSGILMISDGSSLLNCGQSMVLLGISGVFVCVCVCVCVCVSMYFGL